MSHDGNKTSEPFGDGSLGMLPNELRAPKQFATRVS